MDGKKSQKTNNDAVKKSRAKKKKIIEDTKGRKAYLESKANCQLELGSGPT